MNPEFPMRNTTLCYLEQDGKWLMLHRVTKKNLKNHRHAMSLSADNGL